MHVKKGADGTARVLNKVKLQRCIKSGFSRLLKFYRRLVNKAIFDNLKVYSVSNTQPRCGVMHALLSIRSFHAYMRS